VIPLIILLYLPGLFTLPWDRGTLIPSEKFISIIAQGKSFPLFEEHFTIKRHIFIIRPMEHSSSSLERNFVSLSWEEMIQS
jgi:hypothetical protein